MNSKPVQHTIESERLVLINSSTAILETILRGDSLDKYLDILIPDIWTEFGSAPFQYTLDQIKDHPEDSVWWSWLPVLVSENTLIGNCGYKGQPKDGMVEIGYEVAEKYRGQGYATEIAMALIDHAVQDPRVTMIVAHTLAEKNASVRVLQKCGFQFITEIMDPEDGKIWRWEKALS
jgi:[ribosomal protein S5]-alanine N-acetyltransferase